MSTYKLTYFNFTGLGESIRFMLHHGGVDFEDCRVEFQDWPALKPTLPMEQMPILEVDDKTYHQARAISRYVAKQFELYSSDDAEAMEIDMCVDDIEDWRLCKFPLCYSYNRVLRIDNQSQYVSQLLFTVAVYIAYYSEQDPTWKAELLERANAKTSWFLNKFEDRVKANDGFFVGGKLTWADVHFSTITEFLSNMTQKELIEDYPALQEVNENVRSQPNIKAYLDQRPETVL